MLWLCALHAHAQCQLHLLGGEVASLQQLDPRKTSELGVAVINDVLIEYIHWCHSKCFMPVTRQEVQEVVHKT